MCSCLMSKIWDALTCVILRDKSSKIQMWDVCLKCGAIWRNTKCILFFGQIVRNSTSLSLMSSKKWYDEGASTQIVATPKIVDYDILLSPLGVKGNMECILLA